MTLEQLIDEFSFPSGDGHVAIVGGDIYEQTYEYLRELRDLKEKLRWKKWPEEKPEKAGWYLTREITDRHTEFSAGEYLTPKDGSAFWYPCSHASDPRHYGAGPFPHEDKEFYWREIVKV